METDTCSSSSLQAVKHGVWCDAAAQVTYRTRRADEVLTSGTSPRPLERAWEDKGGTPWGPAGEAVTAAVAITEPGSADDHELITGRAKRRLAPLARCIIADVHRPIVALHPGRRSLDAGQIPYTQACVYTTVQADVNVTKASRQGTRSHPWLSLLHHPPRLICCTPAYPRLSGRDNNLRG